MGMMHMFSLALTPTFTIGLNKDFKYPKSWEIQCNSKPSVYAYPKKLEEKKEGKKKRVETVTLSTTAITRHVLPERRPRKMAIKVPRWTLKNLPRKPKRTRRKTVWKWRPRLWRRNQRRKSPNPLRSVSKILPGSPWPNPRFANSISINDTDLSVRARSHLASL